MEKFIRWILVLLVFGGAFQGAHPFVKFKPPRLYPETEDIVVTSGDTISLRCEGNRPINWSIPKYTMDMDEEELAHITVDFSRNSKSEYPFISLLEVRNSYYLDTGYYYCFYQETTDMEAVEDVARKYVFVNDSRNLLVQNTTFGFVMQIQYEPAVIPCKPTSPDVDVKLYKYEEEVLSSDFMTYDPKKGFKFSTFNINDEGIYECIAKRGDAVKRVRFQLQLLPQTDKVSKPNIDEKSIRHVVLGMNVRIECTVQVDIGIVFNMVWKTPNPSGLENDRVQMGDATATKITHNTVEYRIGSRDLIIYNVTHDDEGYYECIVQDHSGNKNSDKKFLQVLGEDIL